jgi:hypothetical protein
LALVVAAALILLGFLKTVTIPYLMELHHLAAAAAQ